MKTAVVAGASRGIGKSITKSLIDDGYKVIAISRNLEQLNNLCQYNTNITPYQMDVTDSSQINQFVNFIKDIDIDLLVHNAGGNFEQATILEANPNNWIKTYELNVIGPLNMTKAIIPKMKDKKDGSVIIITSLVGHTESYPGGAGYTGTKHDAVIFVKNLRNELRGSGIRITEIAPGTTNTESNRHEQAVDSKDIAEAVRWVAGQPKHVSIDLMIVNPI
jgi:NADP-dependent 3-hydroxy acid dehydrogenase YdfG